MAETEIITMDARSEITYEFDEDFAPIGISDAADGTGTPWSAVMQQLAKMEQQVAALTQKSRAWDSVSRKITTGADVSQISFGCTATKLSLFAQTSDGNYQVDFDLRHNPPEHVSLYDFAQRRDNWVL